MLYIQCDNKLDRPRIYCLKFESDNIICRKQIILVRPLYNILLLYIHYIIIIWIYNVKNCKRNNFVVSRIKI